MAKGGAHLERVDVIALGEEVQRVGDEDDSLAVVAEGSDYCIGEERLTNMSIDYIPSD